MKRILVIDDDPSIRFLYEEELLEEGYDVISSGGENDVLQLIADQRPDLILLDLNLGAQNGLDLLQNIRGNFRTTPVILLTAYPAMKFQGKLSSFHACVTKNSDLTGLKQQIEKCLNTPDRPYRNGIITGKDRHAASVKPALQLGMRFHD